MPGTIGISIPRGAGLPCQDIEAGVEFDFDRVNDRQAFDAEKPEHRKKGTPILT